MVLETNCIRQPARHSAQIISLTIMGILLPVMIACVSLANVCSAVKICRIMIKIIWACLPSSCFMQLVSNTKVNLSQPLSPQLVYNRVTTLWLNNQSVFTLYIQGADLSEPLVLFWHRHRVSAWNKLATATLSWLLFIPNTQSHLALLIAWKSVEGDAQIQARVIVTTRCVCPGVPWRRSR